MVIAFRDVVKLFAISVIACCAVFVCTLFLNYNIDLAAIEDEITTEAGMVMYHAQVLMGRVVAGVSGGCLIVPTVAFAAISVLFAYRKLKSPVLDLLRERRNGKARICRDGKECVPFLRDLRGVTRRSRRSLVFLAAFSAFCFSSMLQMSLSMRDLASETFAWMILMIGLTLAFVTLFLSLSGVVRGNTKTIAMMRVFGYDDATCSRYILGLTVPLPASALRSARCISTDCFG